MLMNGAIRALLQAMHPYAKDAVRFRYGGLQIGRKERTTAEEEGERGKKKQGKREERKRKREKRKRTGSIHSLARSFIRATNLSSHVTKVWRKALYNRGSFSRLCLDMIPYRSAPGVGGKDDGGG